MADTHFSTERLDHLGIVAGLCQEIRSKHDEAKERYNIRPSGYCWVARS